MGFAFTTLIVKREQIMVFHVTSGHDRSGQGSVPLWPIWHIAG